MTPEQEQTIQRLYVIRDSLTSYRDINHLSEELNRLIPSLPIPRDPFENQPYWFNQGPTSNYVFRARPLFPGEERFKCYKDISYISRKQSYLARTGRVNRSGDPIFYGSLQPISACIETFTSGDNLRRVVEGNAHHCIVGAWKINAPIRFASLPYAEKSVLEFIKNRNYVPVDGNPVNEINVKSQAQHTREQASDEFKYKLLEFFSEAFALQGDEQYMLSTYYAERVLDKVGGFRAEIENGDKREAHPIEGIFYYAVPSSYEVRNVVIAPDTVKEKLTFSHAYHMIARFDPKNPKSDFTIYEKDVPAVNGWIAWKKEYNKYAQ